MSDNHPPSLVYYQENQRDRFNAVSEAPSPVAEEEFPITVKQVITILRAYRKISLLTFAIVILLVGVIFFVLPKSYTGVASILVEVDSRDPLAAKDTSDFSQSNYLPTQLELIQGDAVLDGVISRLSLTQTPEFAGAAHQNDPSNNDLILTKLREKLDVEQGRFGSQLIYITATASSAALSADIANAVVDSFLEQHYSDTAGPSVEKAKRYSEELASLKQKVIEAQTALTDFRKKSGADYLDSKTNLESDLLNSLEHRLQETRNNLRSSQARIGEARGMTTSTLNSTQVVGLREEGTKLEAQMAQMKTQFGPNHPEVIALQSKIDANKAAQAANQTTLAKATNSDIQVSNSEVESLEKAVAVQRGKVAQMTAFNDREVKYRLEFESAQAVYKKALDGYDQQAFAASGQNSRIRIASRARVPVKASKPHPLKFLALGLAGGLFAALLMPFLLELPRRRVRCRDDIERDMKIPVLAELVPLIK